MTDRLTVISAEIAEDKTDHVVAVTGGRTVVGLVAAKQRPHLAITNLSDLAHRQTPK